MSREPRGRGQFYSLFWGEGIQDLLLHVYLYRSNKIIFKY